MRGMKGIRFCPLVVGFLVLTFSVPVAMLVFGPGAPRFAVGDEVFAFGSDEPMRVEASRLRPVWLTSAQVGPQLVWMYTVRADGWAEARDIYEPHLAGATN